MGFPSAFAWQYLLVHTPKIISFGTINIVSNAFFFSVVRMYVNFYISREILNIVFMTVAVVQSGDLTLVSETASSTSRDRGSRRLTAVPDLPLVDVTFTPVHSH